MRTKKRVAIGLLGAHLDRGRGASRWEYWRPTVALCQHEDLLIDRLELLYEKKYDRLARAVVADLATVSPETEVRSHHVEWDDPWDFEEVYGALLDFARAYAFDSSREDYLVHITTGTHVAQICLFLLTETRYLPATLVQTSPPRRNRKLAPGAYRLIDLDLAKYDRIASRFHLERVEGLSFLKSGIATKNASFNRLVEELERVVIRSKAPILLMGPTGAGKSLLARRVYELKRARHQVDGSFVEVNCATLRGATAMSALFGHVKGAFTGALQERPGLLVAAKGGVLFLDEIAELGADEQAMLLRAVEEKRFLPLGSDEEVSSDFQLIAGTNRNLRQEAAEGRFREDLLARINLWTYTLPGLRDRPEDVEPNLRYELERYGSDHGVHVTMSREASKRFLAFATSPAASWQANFRDFNAAVTRMCTLAPGGRVSKAVVEAEIDRLREGWRSRPRDGGRDRQRECLEGLLGRPALGEFDRFDRVQLAEVVAVCLASRSLSEAGRTLFAESRKRKRKPNDADRLRKYLARFDISWQDIRDLEDRP